MPAAEITPALELRRRAGRLGSTAPALRTRDAVCVVSLPFWTVHSIWPLSATARMRLPHARFTRQLCSSEAAPFPAKQGQSFFSFHF